jgi:hypothetical protein
MESKKKHANALYYSKNRERIKQRAKERYYANRDSILRKMREKRITLLGTVDLGKKPQKDPEKEQKVIDTQIRSLGLESYINLCRAKSKDDIIKAKRKIRRKSQTIEREDGLGNGVFFNGEDEAEAEADMSSPLCPNCLTKSGVIYDSSGEFVCQSCGAVC